MGREVATGVLAEGNEEFSVPQLSLHCMHSHNIR